MYRRVYQPGLLIGLLLFPLILAAQSSAEGDNLEALAEELVRIRGEVESLNAELNRKQDQHRNEMSSLAAQKGELEATLRREQLRVDQLEEELTSNRERAEQAGIAGESLVPVAQEAIDALRRHIETSLPFKPQERMAALDEIQTQLETGSLAPPRAVNRLWGFYEDELRLTRENGLYSQVIELDDEQVLADVARLGTVAMYFQTRDGEYGQAQRSGEDWRFVRLDERAAIQRIDKLFESLKKQIRTGYFELPNGAIRLESEQ
ncbi:DUF3450 domain-containing protein [Wenzhouxiangella sp. XN201]|uniref:DUF3450 family protein n=1 Tax=Wenzhouxiangella sp. XN201 TaxID=2710755 RepID=UPI0013CAD22B|nr:DUF3450 family protein [Wenzhouxiangella sp. XN201]NEZ03931.1 DUF3450 domain-containing protein [Wenzhouxiangella sp. XN201]